LTGSGFICYTSSNRGFLQSRLLYRGEVRQPLEAQALPEAGHLLKPIDELPVSDAQLDLEAVEHHQLRTSSCRAAPVELPVAYTPR
jgi:hypothetical protein